MIIIETLGGELWGKVLNNPTSCWEGGQKVTGIFQHSCDVKGRLFIPARLRDELGSAFFVTLSMENCLSAYSDENWTKFEEKFDAMSRENKNKMRPLFSHAARCELDGQGRILLPQALRDFAGLKKNVTVVGAGDCAQFWDSETWADTDAGETTAENIAAVFRELDF